MGKQCYSKPNRLCQVKQTVVKSALGKHTVVKQTAGTVCNTKCGHMMFPHSWAINAAAVLHWAEQKVEHVAAGTKAAAGAKAMP